MGKKTIIFLLVLALASTTMFSQTQRSQLKKKLLGTWKQTDHNGRSYTQFLIFTDYKNCKFMVVDNPDYPNGTREDFFKYKISKNQTEIIFTSINTEKPEISRRMIRLSSDTLIMSIRSSIYFAKNSYIKQ